MKAMILAAGRGSRLAALTEKTPKPLLPVHGKPLIERQIEQLKAAGLTDLVINLHHLGDQIVGALGDGTHLGVSISYSQEDSPLETGGGVKYALPLLGNEPFVLLNGDIWTDFDFQTLPESLPSPGLAHVVVTPTPQWRERGDFEYRSGYVSARGTAYVYCGIAMLAPEIIEARTETVFSLRDIYFDLIETNRLTAQTFHGEWLDIGTLAEYKSLNA